MPLRRLKTCLLLVSMAAMAVSARAGTIISLFAGQTVPGSVLDSTDAAYVSWTQTAAFSGVSVNPVLSSSGTVDVGYSAYLTNSIGPGTTRGANEIASQNFIMPAGTASAYVTLFSGLDLGPGQYYLILAGLSPGIVNWETGAPGPPPPPVVPRVAIHLGPGVSYTGDGAASGSLAPYVPASTFNLNVAPALLLQVGTPEPSTGILLCVGIAMWPFLRRRF